MKMLTFPRGSARRFEFAGGCEICQKRKTSDMRSFGRHKDQPQPPTAALVLLILTISLLKPFSASALHFDNPCFMFLYGFATRSRLVIRVSAPYIGPSQPNGSLNGISGRAMYSSKVLFWDEATRDVVDCVTQYKASTDSQQVNPFGDKLAPLADLQFEILSVFTVCEFFGHCFVLIFGIRCTDIQSKECSLIYDATFLRPSRGHQARPNSDCVAVNLNRHKNAWGVDGPIVGIHSSDLSFRANVQTAIEKVMKDGSSSNISYDPHTKCLSVVWRDADGNSSNEICHHYCAHSSRAYMPEMVGVCVIAPPESALEYRFTHIWELRSGSQLQVEKATDSWLKWLLIVMGDVVVLLAIIVAWVNCRSKVSSPETERGGEEGNLSANLTEEIENLGIKKFSREELMSMTDSFARDRILGEGGFGIVYKGHREGARTPVAVKKIKSSLRQGIKEYISEVKSLSQVRHKNLVQLIGYCHEASEFFLVYEFMRGGSLQDCLFKEESLLTWERRYNITLGLASAVHYLHKQCDRCVIHRDIKSSNVMLNERFKAKLGDFGMARLVDHTRELNTTEGGGTLGYLAPECYNGSTASKESDVYSFGIVLLEIVCGRKVSYPNLGEQGLSLVQWVWKRYGSWSLAGRGDFSWRWRDKFLKVVDGRLNGNFDKKQAEALLIVGLWCANPIAESRPSIEEAMDVLNFKKEPPKLPTQMPSFKIN